MTITAIARGSESRTRRLGRAASSEKIAMNAKAVEIATPRGTVGSGAGVLFDGGSIPRKVVEMVTVALAPGPTEACMQAAPLGKPEHVNAKVALTPGCGVFVIVTLAEFPALTVARIGAALNADGGTSVVTLSTVFPPA